MNVQLIDTKSTNECYFVDCQVNGKNTKGYVDTRCSVITIRKTDAERLGLKWQDSHRFIDGYAGGVTKALGETDILLQVDLIEQSVGVLIVNDL